MKTILTFLLFMVSSDTLIAQKWNEVRLPKPWEDNLLSTTFVNSTVAVCVGENGTIRRTLDTGHSWSMFQVEKKETLHSVFFVEDSLGITVGESGAIYRTTDTGRTWQKISSNLKGTLHSVHSLENKWIIVGENGGCLRSFDGGKTWAQLQIPISTNLYAVRFIGGNSIVATGENGAVFLSTDNGLIWKKILTEATRTLRLITQAPNGNILSAGDAGQILRSSDSARTWELSIIDTALSINSLYFRDSLHCIANSINNSSGSGYSVLTLDGAKSWGMPYFRGLTTYFHSSISPDGEIEFDAGYKGALRVTRRLTDSTRKNIQTTSYGATFLTQMAKVGNNIFTIGSRYYYSSQDSNGYQIVIFVSHDKGQTWETRVLSYPLTDIWHAITTTTVGSETVVVGGDKGVLLISHDVGETWALRQLPVTQLVSSVAFNNPLNGVATMGAHNTVFITSDGGINWNPLNVPPSTNDRFLKLSAYRDSNQILLYAITFLPNSTVGVNILTTTNNGATWSEKTINLPGEEWIRFFFTDKLHGFAFAARYQQTVSTALAYTTDDGGQTWVKVLDKKLSSGDAIAEAHIIDNKYAVAVSGKGTILYSTNSGGNWLEAPNFNKSEVGVVDGLFLPINSALVLGTFGRIFRLDSVVSGVGIDVVETNTTSVLYPNPANNQITVQVPTAYPANFDLYTLEGVRVLHQELKGSNSYLIDTQELSTGLYISYLQHHQGSYTLLVIISR